MMGEAGYFFCLVETAPFRMPIFKQKVLPMAMRERKLKPTAIKVLEGNPGKRLLKLS